VNIKIDSLPMFKISAEIPKDTNVNIKIDSLPMFNGIIKLSFQCIAILNLPTLCRYTLEDTQVIYCFHVKVKTV